jgi:hypothetical protein
LQHAQPSIYHPKAILLRWSDDDLRDSVFALYAQVYPILLSTLASAKRKELRLFEANLALIITGSPISFFLVCEAYYGAYQNPRSLYDLRENTGKVFARWLGLLLPFIWLGLSLCVSFSTVAFIDSDLCEGTTFAQWLSFSLTSSFIGVLDVMGRRDLYLDYLTRFGLGNVSLIVLQIWCVYFIRHLWDICYVHREKMAQYQRQFAPLRWAISVAYFLRLSW